ncbi:MAG: 50S ribosomal protein L25 [Ilumatobacteraceae bacterium]
MSTKLVAQSRTAAGSSSARRLRAEGHIPAVVYGQGMDPISVSVERRDLRLALSGAAGSNTVLSLEVGGNTYPAVIKELQRHPIKRTVSHIDFLRVNMNEEITVHVPLRLEGEAKAVAAEGGLVDPSVDTIEVTCTPGNIPDEFIIDVSGMHPHDVIRLADVPMPKGVTATGDPEMPVVTVMMTAASNAASVETADAAEAAAEGGDAAE